VENILYNSYGEIKRLKNISMQPLGFGSGHCYHKLNKMRSWLFIILLTCQVQEWIYGQVIEIPADTAQLDIHALAVQIIPNPQAPTAENVKKIVRWTNTNFKWTYTDYQRRTVKQIICRKGGNCNEQARVVSALLQELGIKNRRVSEINIQPDSERRQESAAQRIKEAGLRMSVFGYRHNDHVWIEYFDEEKQEWEPADPTLNLLGLEQWIKARVGFEDRITHSIISSRDMLVPIAVFALHKDGSISENRTERYLLKGFNQVYQYKLDQYPDWNQWTQMIIQMSEKAQLAFEGKFNLHDYTHKILNIKNTYHELKTWYITHHEPWIDFRSGSKPGLMILGTFHFRDAGKDGYKPKFPFNVLSDKRQAEVEDLVNSLAEYKPTKIAVEWKKNTDQPFLDSLYQQYLEGKYTLGENEIYQVSFRLGKKLGHAKLYCVDAPARWYPDVPADSAFAAQFNQSRFDDTLYNDKFYKFYQLQDSLKTVYSLKRSLQRVNSDEADYLFHGHYLIGSYKYAAGNQYPGADNLTGWYNRNLRILSNVLQLAEKEDDRIFLLIGHGHLPILRQAARSTPEIKLTEAMEYLK